MPDVLSSAPWLSTLTTLELFGNRLGLLGHRALSLLHLPRLRTLSLDQNGLNVASLAALASAPWLTQLAKLTLAEVHFANPNSRVRMLREIKDDAGVWGRLRCLGCIVTTHFVDDCREPPSDDDDRDELASDSVLSSGTGSNSDGF